MKKFADIKPIESKYNRYGYKGVKRNDDCKKPYLAMSCRKMLGRYHTAYEAGQAWAWDHYEKNKSSTQQELDLSVMPSKSETEVLVMPVVYSREAVTAIIEDGFISLLRDNDTLHFSTSELVDEIFDLRPSERRNMLKDNGRIKYHGIDYSYSALDHYFKEWSGQHTEVEYYKNRGINYYKWHETNEYRALRLIRKEYGTLNSAPSSFEELDDCVRVYYANGDFGFKVSLDKNKVIGFKVGLKSFNWEV